jgi:hypothetical protein
VISFGFLFPSVNVIKLVLVIVMGDRHVWSCDGWSWLWQDEWNF